MTESAHPSISGTPSGTQLGTFERLARESQAMIEQGIPFYELLVGEDGLLHVDPIHAEELGNVSEETHEAIFSVLNHIPVSCFRINRSVIEYTRKHGISPIDLIQIIVSGGITQPHIVLELGPGTGRVLSYAEEHFEGRGISFFGEADHFYYKMSRVIGESLKRDMLEKAIREEFDEELGESKKEEDEIAEIITEFSWILGNFLNQKDDVMEDISRGLNEFMPKLTQINIWEGLEESISALIHYQTRIPNKRRPHINSSGMRELLHRFSENPSLYFKEFPPNFEPEKDPSFLGISSERIILGGDMRDFMDTVSKESLSVVFGTRSSVYIVDDEPEGGDTETHDIVDFGLKIAEKLKEGGAWLDDFVRANYGVKYHIDSVLELAKRIEADDDLRAKCKVFLIWGPSDELHEEHKYVPLSMLLLKNSDTEAMERTAESIRKSFITSTKRGDNFFDVNFELLEVDPASSADALKSRMEKEDSGDIPTNEIQDLVTILRQKVASAAKKSRRRKRSSHPKQ